MSAPRSYHVTFLALGPAGALEVYRRSDPDDGFGRPAGSIIFGIESEGAKDRWMVLEYPGGGVLKSFDRLDEAQKFAREHFGRGEPA